MTGRWNSTLPTLSDRESCGSKTLTCDGIILEKCAVDISFQMDRWWLGPRSHELKVRVSITIMLYTLPFVEDIFASLHKDANIIKKMLLLLLRWLFCSIKTMFRSIYFLVESVMIDRYLCYNLMCWLYFLDVIDGVIISTTRWRIYYHVKGNILESINKYWCLWCFNVSIEEFVIEIYNLN
jgi:hypothetical protein